VYEIGKKSIRHSINVTDNACAKNRIIR